MEGSDCGIGNIYEFVWRGVKKSLKTQAGCTSRDSNQTLPNTSHKHPCRNTLQDAVFFNNILLLKYLEGSNIQRKPEIFHSLPQIFQISEELSNKNYITGQFYKQLNNSSVIRLFCPCQGLVRLRRIRLYGRNKYCCQLTRTSLLLVALRS